MFAASKTDSVSGETPDPQFNYVTMLLHGDGTNGAQNNTFLDSSTNNFTITRNGNTTQGSFSPYGSNWGNAFTASSGSYLSVPYSSAFNLTGDFTVECWINPSQLPTGTGVGSPLYPRIFSFGTYNAANSIGLEINSNDSGTVNAIVVWYNQSQYYSANNIVAAGNWYHCAMVRSGTVITIYLNGTSVITITGASAAVNTSQALLIASLQSFTADANACFKGNISNFRVVKGTAVYTTSFTPPTTPLTAITNTVLLTCQSNRFVDNSTTAATITPFGTPSVQRFNPFGTATAYSTSVIGGSGYFDGSGDYLNTPSSSQFTASGDFTVSCWFYLQSFTNAYYVVGGNWDDSSTSGEWLIQIQNNGAIRFLTTANGSFSSSGVVKLNQWTYFTATRFGTTVTVQLNGTTVNTYTKTDTLGATNKTITIGQQTSGYWPFNGYISDFRLLSGSAITTIPTAPVSSTSTGLLLSMTNGAIFDNAMMNDLETVGNAQISTSVKKYGTGSLAFDGSGDYLFEPATQLLAWGTGNFTIEMWINTSTTSVSGGASRTMWGTSSASYQGQLYLEVSTGKVVFGNTGSTFLKGTSNVADGNWNHIAISRSGTTCRLFVNGTQEASGTNSVNYDAQPTFIGAFGASDGFFNGYIDDLRITKGYARYTATFTPPTAAFSDTGPY